MATKNGVPFRQVLVPASKYNIKAPYAMNPKKITLHNTDNQMPAINEINYMDSNNNQVSYHVAIDEKEAIQGIPFNRNAWHSGDGGNGYGNRNTVAVEICRNYDRTRKTTNLIEPLKSQYSKAEQNTIKYVAQLCIDLGIVANNNNIKTHNNWNGKWCPSKILNEGRLQAVKNAIIVEYNRLVGKEVSKPLPVKQSKSDGHLTFNQVVDKAIAGGYGNGTARKNNVNKLTNYNYTEVQKAVNAKLGASTTKPTKSIDQLAREVIDGKHGTGEARKKALGNQYNAVQKRVNEILGAKPKTTPKPSKSIETLAREVIDGKHGTGDARKKSLGSQYQAVQKRVNQILGAGSSNRKSIDTIAREVIDGKWGNDPERSRRLRQAGYDAKAVQRRVNQLL